MDLTRSISSGDPAGYIDRILKGGKPADLPTPAPTKYEVVINLQERQGTWPYHPNTLIGHANEVIE